MTGRMPAAAAPPSGAPAPQTFDFQPLGRVVFAPGALARLGEIVRELGGRRALLVTDPGLEHAGHPQRAEKSIREAGLEVFTFDGVKENPTEREVEAGVVFARTHGIETVYQDRALAEQQTITRNIFMGRERGGFLGFLDVKKENEEANKLMRSIGFTSRVFAADSQVFTLSGGERQGVAIARALYFKAKLIILDEPTTALSLTESEKVFHFVRQAKEGGASVVFISHNIYHTYDISDRFVVLDRGRVVLKTDKAKTTANELVKSMQDIARSGHAA